MQTARLFWCWQTLQTGHENIGKFVLEVPAQPQEDEDGI